MNGRERVARAMRHQLPDRVPVFCQLALGHYFLNAGRPPREIWFTSEGFAEALVTLQRRYRFDGLLINLPGRPADALASVERVEQTAAGERLVWTTGDITLLPPDDNPHHYAANGEELQRADFDSLDPDHLETMNDLPGYLWNIYHIPRLTGTVRPGLLSDVPACFLRTIELVQQKTGGEVSIHGEVFSPFTHFMELFGYTQALMALVTHPTKARALLDRLTEPAMTWGVAQARQGIDAVLVSSAFAGAGFISRRMYTEFVLPYERKLNRAIRATGIPVYTHTCGRIGDRLDLLIETETCGLDTLDPPPLGDVELADAKGVTGRRVFIKGNMDSVSLLACQTREEVVAAATTCLQHGKPGGGYILSTACSVAPRVQPWKLELLVPLAEEFGRYDG